MHVGIFQCAGGGLTPGQRLAKLALNLKDATLDLIVCPELFASGYNAGDELVEYADLQVGLFSSQAANIAREYKTAIVYGYSEKDGDDIYNSALCIDAMGEITANHRKLLLPPGFESDYFTVGADTTLFQLGGITFAILICYDAEYPEAVRHVAQSGAQVVIVPTALAENWGVVAEKLMPTRAFENGVWVIYANHAGTENGLKYYGGSCIVAPNGKDVARAQAEECLISSNVDTESVRDAQIRLPYLKGVIELNKKLG